MPIRVVEIHPPSSAMVIDFIWPPLARIGPPWLPVYLQANERPVEIVVAEQERVMLGGDRRIVVVEVQRHLVVEPDDQHRPERLWRRQAEKFDQKMCRPVLVAAPDNGVVQLSTHGGLSQRARICFQISPACCAMTALA